MVEGCCVFIRWHYSSYCTYASTHAFVYYPSAKRSPGAALRQLMRTKSSSAMEILLEVFPPRWRGSRQSFTHRPVVSQRREVSQGCAL